ncbi:MAG: FAD:protein FMN transferase [Dehalococcoidia bacterium]
MRRSVVAMDTTVTIEVGTGESREAEATLRRAFAWFQRVETTCSRFDADSELSRLNASSGEPVRVPPLLLEPLGFALALAEETGGAFDPTVGAAMAAAGFDRNYRTGERTDARAATDATFRDVIFDRRARQVRLRRPLTLDLGAVAKGFAIDLAARELAGFERVAVSAGGDLLIRTPDGERFEVGIQHPRDAEALIEVLSLGEGAVCTSGDYQRVSAGGHHLLDGRCRRPALEAASVTVVASTAMLADGLSTAAFALGPERGLELLVASGVEGVIVTPDLEWHATPGFWELRR